MSVSKRTNASTGGHRYRAALSPQIREEYNRLGDDTTTPSKTLMSVSKRINASTGGHRYRAALSSQIDDEDKNVEDDKVSKVLFQ